MKKILLILLSLSWCITLIAQNEGISSQMDISPNVSHPVYDPSQEAIWDLLLGFDVTTLSGAAGNAGAEWNGTYFYSTRWVTNLIHEYDATGTTLIRQFSVTGVTGLRDLAFDGTYMYGGAASTTIYQMDFATSTLVGTITSPVPVRFIAYDDGADAFWVGNWNTPPTLVSRTGATLATITTGLTGQYGAAYDNVSAGGPYLWVFDQTAGGAVIHQYNIATGLPTGVTHDVAADFPGTAGIAGGLFSMTDWAAGYFTIGGLLQGTPDNMFVYEIAPTGVVPGPGPATNPNPAQGAIGVPAPNVTLSWDNPVGATTNAVYFGTNPGSLTLIHSGSLINSIARTGLSYYTQYFWRVDETDGTGTTTGFTWSFTTMLDPSGISLPYCQYFDAATFPAYWSQTSTISPRWTVSNSNQAGGTPYEMKATWVTGIGTSRLIVGPINTTGMTNLSLDFKHYYNDFAAGATMKIQSSPNATTWTDEAFSFASGGGSIGPVTVNTTIANNIGTTTYIAWVIDGDHYQINYWHIDDVCISQQLTNDVGTVSVDVASTIGPGVIAPQATVKNFGTATQTFNVQMTITGGYTSTKTVTGLAAGTTQQVTFDNWNPTVGLYTVNVCTQLGTDQNTSNDCMLKDVNVSSAYWSSGSVYPITIYMGSGVGSNGYLYSIGGNTPSLLSTECYKYSVATDIWSPIALLPAGRVVLATAIVGNYLYAIGGYDTGGLTTSSVYRYDILGDAWSTVAPLPIALGWCKAIAYNSRIYLAGGYDGANVVSSVYVYNVATDIWATATPMPAARFGGAFSVTGDKLVYVAGADLALIYSDVYVGTIDGTDPLLINWTTMMNPYPGTGKESYSLYNGNMAESMVNMSKPNELTEATPYPAGTMYRFDAAPWGTDGIIVANGSPTASWVPANPNPCYVYKPGTDTWTQQADVPIPVLGASLGSVNSGTTWNLIVASGYTGSAVTDATQIYTDVLGGTTTFQLTVNVADGWNMVSVPGINPDGQGIDNWWINRVGNVYKFSGGYVSVATTTPGEGYWMKNNGAQIYNTGDEWPAGGIQIVSHDPIPGASGWNLIGPYEEVIPADAIHVTSNPAGQVLFPIYKYSGGYSVATTLDPGYAYWVKLSSAAQILLSALPLAKSEVEYFAEDWGRIILTDATGINYTLYAVKGEVDLSQYELPPAPPTGMFDIRFSSGRIAEDLNSAIQTIEMNGITYPLTVRVEGMDIRLQDETGKVINVNLKSGEDVVISDATIQKLMVTGELIPAEYALEQNYPNPFNPSTVIEFSLPEDVGNVKLSIYNTLGEKVAELVNTALTAGKYQYQWNAQNAATGMYIYELRTDKFVSVKKMLLLK